MACKAIEATYGALYRRYPAARREGAVFDQRALDILCAGDCGLDCGHLAVLAVATDRYRRNRAVMPVGRGRRGDRGTVLDRESLVPPLDHRNRRHQPARRPQDRLHQATYV